MKATGSQGYSEGARRATLEVYTAQDHHHRCCNADFNALTLPTGIDGYGNTVHCVNLDSISDASYRENRLHQRVHAPDENMHLTVPKNPQIWVFVTTQRWRPTCKQSRASQHSYSPRLHLSQRHEIRIVFSRFTR